MQWFKPSGQNAKGGAGGGADLDLLHPEAAAGVRRPLGVHPHPCPHPTGWLCPDSKSTWAMLSPGDAAGDGVTEKQGEREMKRHPQSTPHTLIKNRFLNNVIKYINITINIYQNTRNL